jgi:hypothetical protein
VQEVERLAHPDVGHGLVDDLLGRDRGDPDGERRAEHDPVLAQALAGDQRRLHHQPRPGVQIAVAQDLVEGEVVEVLDQVGDRERGHVAGEQFVVDFPACSLGATAVTSQGSGTRRMVTGPAFAR